MSEPRVPKIEIISMFRLVEPLEPDVVLAGRLIYRVGRRVMHDLEVACYRGNARYIRIKANTPTSALHFLVQHELLQRAAEYVDRAANECEAAP